MLRSLPILMLLSALTPNGAAQSVEVALGPIPQLSGNLEKDRVNILASLERLKTVWKANQVQLVKLMARRAAGSAVTRAEARNDACRRRAADLQRLLVTVKSAKRKATKRRSGALPAVPRLTGVREVDRKVVMQALEDLLVRWQANRDLHTAMMLKPGSPDRAALDRVVARNEACRKRASEIQHALTRVRRGESDTGVPALPALTGNRQQDVAAHVAVLEQLKSVWDRNRAAHASLMSAKAKGDSPELRRLDAVNRACQQRAGELRKRLGSLRRSR